jgi:hypothetical protein
LVDLKLAEILLGGDYEDKRDQWFYFNK